MNFVVDSYNSEAPSAIPGKQTLFIELFSLITLIKVNKEVNKNKTKLCVNVSSKGNVLNDIAMTHLSVSLPQQVGHVTIRTVSHWVKSLVTYDIQVYHRDPACVPFLKQA